MVVPVMASEAQNIANDRRLCAVIPIRPDVELNQNAARHHQNTGLNTSKIERARSAVD
jgi:hypothetical protein